MRRKTKIDVIYLQRAKIFVSYIIKQQKTFKIWHKQLKCRPIKVIHAQPCSHVVSFLSICFLDLLIINMAQFSVWNWKATVCVCSVYISGDFTIQWLLIFCSRWPGIEQQCSPETINYCLCLYTAVSPRPLTIPAALGVTFSHKQNYSFQPANELIDIDALTFYLAKCLSNAGIADSLKVRHQFWYFVSLSATILRGKIAVG